MKRDDDDLTGARLLRQKAEEQLVDSQKREGVSAIDGDMKKLLHELQVHQIELEMQNEELRIAIETAEIALKKYTMLYDFSPMGYLTLERDGSIFELNFTAAEMLGEKRFSLVNHNFKLFVSDESHSVFDDFLKKVFSSNSNESCKIVLGYDEKFLCSVYMEGIAIEDDHKCLLSVVDITKLTRKSNYL